MADSIHAWQDEAWWPSFGDTTLNKLMDEAFSENLTLSQSTQRLMQYKAALTSARATWFPGISASGSYTESDYLESDNSAPATGQSGATTTVSVGLTATYEIDLWGKLHANRGAAYASYLAGREDLRALILTTSANVARSYYTIVELKQHQQLLQKTVQAYTDNCNLIRERYERGVSASSDVYQAQSTLSSAKAQLAQTESNLAVAEHALSVLLGRYPETGIVPADIELPIAIEVPQPGIPSELLKRRPDVQAAYQSMVAADREAAAAVASMFPSISLTGTLTGTGEDFDEATDPTNILWRAVGSVTQPLFQGGQLYANSKRASAVWRASVDAYRLAALSAFQDVEDALIQGKKQLEYVQHLETQTRAAEATLRLARDNYLQGVTNYLTVVVAQNSYLTAERNLISGKRALVEARISLITALGGGWTEDVIENHLSMD